MNRRLLIAAAAFLGSCGHLDDPCTLIAQQYANEIHEVAIHCDPSAADPCSGQLPVIVYEQSLDGGLKLEGLAGNCTHAVSPNHTANGQHLFEAYVAHGCSTMMVPFCPGQANECSDQLPDGAWICR
ncbi:MAG TPA: hypothetical protein VFA79_15670 [Myxococcales bacterium]|nr:hypothetical protein [Myxococcales bacterium]